MSTIMKDGPGVPAGRSATAIALALKVLRDEIGCLPPEDQADVYELIVATKDVDSAEDLKSILDTLGEILERRPAGVRQMDLNVPDRSGGLQKWMDFVGGRIKAARVEAEITQEQLAERTGIPQSHISRLEAAKHSPSRVTLERIAEALGRPLAFFDPSA